MAEFKMDAIINLSENTWVKFFLCKWLNPRWQHSSWLPTSSSVRMNEFESDWIRLSQSFVQNGRIQDGCQHLVNQIALVWVRVRVEREWFEWIWEKITRCLNPRWQVWIQHGRVQGGCHHQVDSEWMIQGFFVQRVGTNLGRCEWVWEGKLRWLNANWQNGWI